MYGIASTIKAPIMENVHVDNKFKAAGNYDARHK